MGDNSAEAWVDLLGSEGTSCKQVQQNTKLDHSRGSDQLDHSRGRKTVYWGTDCWAASERREQQASWQESEWVLYESLKGVVLELMQTSSALVGARHTLPPSVDHQRQRWEVVALMTNRNPH